MTNSSVNSIDNQVVQILRLILKNTSYFKQMLRLPRNSPISIDIHRSTSTALVEHLQAYLTEIRTITRLDNIELSPSVFSKFSFRDYLTDDIDLIFNLTDDSSTRELVSKHEERLSKQVDKFHDDLNNNETAMNFHRENNDEENVQREQRRREILMDEMKLHQRRHETFVQLTQKRTVIDKTTKKKNK